MRMGMCGVMTPLAVGRDGGEWRDVDLCCATLDGESFGGNVVNGSIDFHGSVYEKCARFLIFGYSKVVITNGKKVRHECGVVAMAPKVSRQFRWLLTPEEDGRIRASIGSGRTS